MSWKFRVEEGKQRVVSGDTAVWLKGQSGAKQRAQWVEDLLCESEDLRLILSLVYHTKAVGGKYTCNPSTREAEEEDRCGLLASWFG